MDHPLPTAEPIGPTTTEAFVADRQRFWARFTHFLVTSIVVVVIVLVGMAIFLL
jgi:hypothetical protein